MTWISVDTSADLDQLAAANCWEDSEVLEFYATPANAAYFPSDISRSGYRNMNIHILVDACSTNGPIMELVFIDADYSSLSYLTQPFIAGRIDSLKRVTIEDNKGHTKMRCSRLIYRFMEEEPIHRSGRYYTTAQQADEAEA